MEDGFDLVEALVPSLTEEVVDLDAIVVGDAQLLKGGSYLSGDAPLGAVHRYPGTLGVEGYRRAWREGGVCVRLDEDASLHRGIWPSGAHLPIHGDVLGWACATLRLVPLAQGVQEVVAHVEQAAVTIQICDGQKDKDQRQ